MTALRDRKSKLSFETDETIRATGKLKLRPIIIEVSPHIAYVRLKGKRRRYEISWTTVYEQACRIAAEKERAERKERRKRKKMGLA